jgi:hypothetical protein
MDWMILSNPRPGQEVLTSNPKICNLSANDWKSLATLHSDDKAPRLKKQVEFRYTRNRSVTGGVVVILEKSFCCQHGASFQKDSYRMTLSSICN